MKNIIIVLCCILSLSLVALMPYSGGSPGGKTGSISDSKTCTQCHSGTASSISNWISSSIPEEGYTPGETYSITVEGTHSGVSKFGFEITAEDKSGNKKGVFIITDAAQTKLANNSKSVTHKSTGNTPAGNSKSWSFNWTAPEASSGEITLFAAFNAANGDGETSGDVIYTSILALTENLGTGVSDQALNDNIFKAYQSFDPNIMVVEFPDTSQKLEKIKVFDTSGRLLLERTLDNFSTGPIILNIPELKTNIYFIQIQTNQTTHTHKTLITK